MSGLFDLARFVNALIIGLVVAIVSMVFVHRKINYKEIGLLAGCTAASMLLMQTFVPAIIPSLHQGIGLAMGAQLVGI